MAPTDTPRYLGDQRNRETLSAALTPLHACRPELGRGIAASIVAVRATTDSSLALTAFDGAFVYRDSAILRAAAEVARDRSASELVRALGFLSLYTTLTPAGYQPSLRDLTTQPLTADQCVFGVATDTGDGVELTPRSAGLIASIGDMAKSVQGDPNESRALRSAATWVLGVWRAAAGVRWADRRHNQRRRPRKLRGRLLVHERAWLGGTAALLCAAAEPNSH